MQLHFFEFDRLSRLLKTRIMKPQRFSLALALTVFAPPLFGAKGDDLLKQYFELETVKTEESFLAGVESKED